MITSPGSRSELHTSRSTNPGASSTRCARRRKAATSSSTRSAGTRRRDIDTYSDVGRPAMLGTLARTRQRLRNHRGPDSRRQPTRRPAGRAAPWSLRVPGSAARDGRQYRDLVAVGDRRRQPVEEADVLALQVDVDEAAQLPVLAREPVAQLAVLGVQRLEHLADGRAVGARLRGTAGGGPQLRRELDRDRHQTATSCTSTASKASNRGSICATSTLSRTASSVLSPSPVM